MQALKHNLIILFKREKKKYLKALLGKISLISLNLHLKVY